MDEFREPVARGGGFCTRQTTLVSDREPSTLQRRCYGRERVVRALGREAVEGVMLGGRVCLERDGT